MLDVHAPEHSISNLREFLIHLLTITIGLLIALGLEDAASAIHHRRERREAETMIRQELQDNYDGALKAAPLVLQERVTMAQLLAYLQERSEGRPAQPPAGLSLAFSENEIPDAAWRTASSTGVLAFMDYGEVEKLAAAYREQDLLQATEQQTLRDILQLSSFKAKGLETLSPASATAALPYVRTALGDLNGILSVGQGVLDAYRDALK